MKPSRVRLHLFLFLLFFLMLIFQYFICFILALLLYPLCLIKMFYEKRILIVCSIFLFVLHNFAINSRQINVLNLIVLFFDEDLQLLVSVQSILFLCFHGQILTFNQDHHLQEVFIEILLNFYVSFYYLTALFIMMLIQMIQNHFFCELFEQPQPG